MSRVTFAFGAVVALSGLAAGPPRPQAPASVEWRTFSGSWSAVGRRQTLPTGGERPAAVINLSGAVVLITGEGLSRGFRGEAIGFDDGGKIVVGRATWTDDHGDQVFSALEGDPVQTGRRIRGTFTGGTGRYAGLTGDYTLSWQYVVAEAAVIQGRAVDLQGRFRIGREAP